MGKTNAHMSMKMTNMSCACKVHDNHVLGMKLQVNVLNAHELEMEHFVKTCM